MDTQRRIYESLLHALDFEIYRMNGSTFKKFEKIGKKDFIDFVKDKKRKDGKFRQNRKCARALW